MLASDVLKLLSANPAGGIIVDGSVQATGGNFTPGGITVAQASSFLDNLSVSGTLFNAGGINGAINAGPLTDLSVAMPPAGVLGWFVCGRFTLIAGDEANSFVALRINDGADELCDNVDSSPPQLANPVRYGDEVFGIAGADNTNDHVVSFAGILATLPSDVGTVFWGASFIDEPDAGDPEAAVRANRIIGRSDQAPVVTVSLHSAIASQIVDAGIRVFAL